MDASPDALFETDRLSVHLLSPGDEPRLQAVFAAAADYFAAVLGVPGVPPAAAEAEIAGSAGAEGRRVAVLRLRGGGDVGAMGWWRGNPEPDVALLGMLLIDPAHRARGLGREALEGLQVLLAGGGVRRLRTAFPYRRIALPPIVRALGFREMSIADHALLGKAGAATSLWEKPLGTPGTPSPP